MPPSVLLGCGRCGSDLEETFRYEIVTGSTLANGGLAMKSVGRGGALCEGAIEAEMKKQEEKKKKKKNLSPAAIPLSNITVPLKELENMYISPSLICVNEATESLVMGSTPTLPVIDTPIAQAPPIVQRGGNGIAESVLGSNRFASLIYLEGEEEDLMSSDIETNSNDLMTPFGKRILRERPVKSTAKVRKMHFQFTGSGRGNRGRGSG
ncbi:hypothetical protein F2Q70_00015155 [Brassica cretica]|uniref:Uncharacterized protein n=1 Tax=Brassica cretica TaxID=69181 RepID=A0A8S9KSF7_BRACR|nr:hypothetical protein F2Q70_00015155 [Brassica cretica]KAF2597385.1 hypothetical protein F2Q68_00008231 [Brassica cretica]